MSADPSPCQSCGACCAYDETWPRFWTDSEEAIARIPANLVAEDGSGMGWDGSRCKALAGIVCEATMCTIYAVRPEVCHACQPGDEACNIAREHYGMDPIEAPIAD